jgi:hypothetical protein
MQKVHTTEKPAETTAILGNTLILFNEAFDVKDSRY